MVRTVIINRRKLLKFAARSLALVCSGLLTACARAARRPVDNRRALLGEIGRLRSRDYGETGVSMLLAGENLPSAVSRHRDLGGTRLAARLERYAALLLEARPDAGAGDVAALVEVIADEDFAIPGEVSGS